MEEIIIFRKLALLQKINLIHRVLIFPLLREEEREKGPWERGWPKISKIARGSLVLHVLELRIPYYQGL